MIDSLIVVGAIVYIYLMIRCILGRRRGTLPSLARAHRYALTGAAVEFVIAGLWWVQSGVGVAVLNAGMAIAVVVTVGRRLDRMEQEVVRKLLES